jgi:hypothetical protein
MEGEQDDRRESRPHPIGTLTFTNCRVRPDAVSWASRARASRARWAPLDVFRTSSAPRHWASRVARSTKRSRT